MKRVILPSLLILFAACSSPSGNGMGPADLSVPSEPDLAGPKLTAQISGPSSLTVYERVSPVSYTHLPSVRFHIPLRIFFGVGNLHCKRLSE